MARETETVFIGRANITRRVLQSEATDLLEGPRNAITRVMAHFGEYCLDTNVGADPIEYVAADGAVEMQLGLVPGIAVGRYELLVTCFDAATPEGYAWGEFRIDVKPWPICDV